MELIIKIERRIVKIILKKDRKKIDETFFVDQHNLTEKLIKSIDALLKKSKFKVTNIRMAKMSSDSNDSLTSNRIVKTVVDSINWANKEIKTSI
jgi:hypothetical protein